MGNISVALCIPTYQRNEMVEEFLKESAIYYLDAGIDIYFYGKKDDQATKNTVRKYQEQNRIHFIERPDDSVVLTDLKIFQGYKLEKEYDFIWLCNDAIQLKKDAITIVMANLSVNYDIVEINGTGHGAGTRIFRNCNEYMQQCAWHTTLLGAVLLNVHTMLKGISWDNYDQLFDVEKGSYAHVAFYFNRILELKRFCALHLAMDPKIVRGSKYKKAPGWIHNCFKILFEDWLSAIEGLPDYYTGKDDAMRKIEYFDLLTGKALCYRRIDGDYTLKEYMKYRCDFAKLMTVPNYKLLALALTPRGIVKKILELRMKKSKELNRLQKFYKSFSQIIIFGIGDSAFRYTKYFEQQKMEFLGFCAQRPHGRKEYMGHPIFGIDDLAQMESIGVIVALGEDGARVAIPDITKKLSTDSVYFSADLEVVIFYELGYNVG